MSKKSQSIVYVRDTAQQVQFGIIKNWEDIDEKINKERVAILHKVCRNTRNILQYTQSLR